MQKNKKHPLSGFFAQGVPKTNNISGGQYVSTCPFCEGEDKFYINIQNKLWDCKRCGLAGNYLQFLEKIHQENIKFVKPFHIEMLAADRSLPEEAFKKWEVGFDNKKFTFPVYSVEGKFIGIRTYQPGNHIMGAADTKVGLIGARGLLDKSRYEEPVYVCEGDWDTIALEWLLRELGEPGIVVGVPGANTFKDEWAQHFFGKTVYSLYDHDDPGIAGELKLHGMLKDIAETVYYLHWPEDKIDGYDIRDLVSTIAFHRKKPKKCFNLIKKWVQEVPRSLKQYAVIGEDGKLTIDELRKEKLEPITFQEMIEAFQEILYMPDITPIKVMLATVLANRIDGEMVWMFLVAPPSSAKTELIRSLSSLHNVVALSGLTANTLHSGFNGPGNQDYSLIKDLDKKILTIKDFTGILTMFAAKRDEIFGQLRDAYDGETAKRWGNTMTRSYKAKFGIIAGVTDSIERFGTIHQTLGERFLRYRMPVITTENEAMIGLRKSMSNTGHHTDKRKRVADAVKRFFGTYPEVSAVVPEEILTKLMYLARFTALMRGFVEKGFQQDILYKPTSEAPHRLCKQLFQMGIGLAGLEKKPEMDWEDYRIIKEIALGTCPQRVSVLVRTLHETDAPMRLSEIAGFSKFDAFTIRIVIKDLVSIGLINIEIVGRTALYTLTDHAKHLIKESGIFPEVQRKKVIFKLI